MVPKRWAKRAVTRNAIKRQIYSLSSELETTSADQAHVVRLRAAFDRAQYVSATSDALKRAVRSELQQLFPVRWRHDQACADGHGPRLPFVPEPLARFVVPL